MKHGFIQKDSPLFKEFEKDSGQQAIMKLI